MNKIAFHDIVNDLYALNQRFPEMKLYTLSVCQNNDIFEYAFSDCSDIINVRSLSKLIVSLCIGILMDSPIFRHKDSINTKILPTFENCFSLISDKQNSKFKELTIHHLLTQTTGFATENLLFSDTLKDIDPENIIYMALNDPIINTPGTCFAYSNASAFILSVYLQLVTEENLYSYAIRHLFSPMGICDHNWLQYGKYCAGGTGLFLSPFDVLKIGILLLQNGSFYGKQLIPINYIKSMQMAHVSINNIKYDNCLHPKSYGYFIWSSDNDVFFASGANGKYIIVAPLKNTVVSIITETNKPNLILQCIKPLFM